VRPPLFVDCHSHVVPSGDDGVATVGEGRSLCVEAARRGTRVLYATPHVWPHLRLDEEREQRVRRAHAALVDGLPLELRLGFELTPSPPLLGEDLGRYALDGLPAVLMEVPFSGPGEPVVALAERAQAQGLTPVIAHPERAEAVHAEAELARELAHRGWLLQLNATSLLGQHGSLSEAIAWELLEDGLAALVASDGHRAARPPHLDEAYDAARRRVGEARALPLFDGSALGLGAGAASAPVPSRGATTAA
jgi:protein-tyrosine phosphatase